MSRPGMSASGNAILKRYILIVLWKVVRVSDDFKVMESLFKICSRHSYRESGHAQVELNSAQTLLGKFSPNLT